MGDVNGPPDEDFMRTFIDLQRQVADLTNAIASGGNTMPGDLIASYATQRAGAILCNGGGPYATADYPLLGPILTAAGYSSDGGITFLVPDYRGQTIIGTGTGPGLTARVLGVSYGAETHLLTGPESGIATHNHTVAATTGSTTPGDVGSTTPGATGSTTPGTQTSSSAGAITAASANTGALAPGAGSFDTALPLSIPNHTHTVAGVAHTHTSAAHVHTNTAHTHALPDTDAIANTNATTAHSIMQPSRAANIFIKV